MIAESALHDELARLAADEAGLQPGAVEAQPIEQFVEHSVKQGIGVAALWARARTRDPQLVEALLSVVLVGETFFFRDPEHFQLVRDVIAARPEASRCVRAWSAGCASGEEAYSLAATLRVATPGPIEVLGTDLSARALARACAGTYGKWSRREAGPMLYPVGVVEGDLLRVDDELRRAVRYVRHNLLDPPPVPDGGFDVVMCRNVFVYLRDDAARRVARHLRDALAPGGLLILGTFGAMDDPELAPIGPREIGAFIVRTQGAADVDSAAIAAVPRRAAAALGTAPVRVVQPPPRLHAPIAPRRSRTPTAEQPADHVAIHLQAIHLIEAQRLAEAEVLLAALIGRASYAPALLELALISERRGRPARAAELANRLLEQLAGRDPDDEVPGPETLPVRYYTSTARTFLARLRGRA
jgi:chemotaxis methyl-accepting protein methylase